MRGRTSLKAIEGEGGRSVLDEEDEEDVISDPTGGGEGVKKKKEPALGFTAMQLQPFPAVSRVGLDCTSGGGARTQVALQPSHPSTPHRPRRPHPGRLRVGEEEGEARKELRNGSIADKDQEQRSNQEFCNAHKNTIVSMYINVRPSLSLPFQDINYNESISKLNKWK